MNSNFSVENDNNSMAMFMSAIDGGYCTLVHDEKLTILYASSKVGHVLGTDKVLALTDFLSENDKNTFFKAYRPFDNFSVMCNLQFGNRIVPATLKCRGADQYIYCDITMQMDWYNYAAKVIDKNLNYSKLLEYTNTYMFAANTDWSFVVVSSGFKKLFKIDRLMDNFNILLTDHGIVHPSCNTEVQKILKINPLSGKHSTHRLLLKIDDDWKWFRLELNTIYSKQFNKVVNVVGNFVLVDEEYGTSTESSVKIFDLDFLSSDFIQSKLSARSWFIKFQYNTLADLEGSLSSKEYQTLLANFNKTLEEFGKEHLVVLSKVSERGFIIAFLSAEPQDVKSLVHDLQQTIQGFFNDYGTKAVMLIAAAHNLKDEKAEQLLDRADKIFKQAFNKQQPNGCILIDK